MPDKEDKNERPSIDQVTDWWRTGIVDIAPGKISFRGYAVEDLIGRVSFPAMIWLMLRGELPNAAQAKLFGALLVAGVDHGPQAPSIAIARMAASCGVGISNAMASGINALGDVHGGAGQQCMELFADIEKRRVEGNTLEQAVTDGLGTFRAKNGKFIPGFGHRYHRIDPRVVRLRKLLDEAVIAGTVRGNFLALGRAVEKAINVGMNIDGITATMLLEFGFASELGRGVFVLSRAVGVCAHSLEQMREPSRIKGPTPPGVGFRYTGPPPRPLPPGDFGS